jgi:hypothetical protein
MHLRQGRRRLASRHLLPLQTHLQDRAHAAVRDCVDLKSPLAGRLQPLRPVALAQPHDPQT